MPIEARISTEAALAAEELAGILAAQAGDDIAYHREAAARLLRFMSLRGWTLVRQPAPTAPDNGGPAPA